MDYDCDRWICCSVLDTVLDSEKSCYEIYRNLNIVAQKKLGNE